MIATFKQMSAYLEEHAGVKIHSETLRKAVADERNPLPVVWDGGVATIEPLQLIRWRENRKGLPRRNHKSP